MGVGFGFGRGWGFRLLTWCFGCCGWCFVVLWGFTWWVKGCGGGNGVCSGVFDAGVPSRSAIIECKKKPVSLRGGHPHDEGYQHDEAAAC